MVLPELSSADRAAASAAALSARRRRAEVKAEVAAGRMGIGEVMVLAQDEPSVAKLRVVELLEALPRVGPVRAEAIMAEAQIAPTRRLRGLGQRQRQALLAHFEGM